MALSADSITMVIKCWLYLSTPFWPFNDQNGISKHASRYSSNKPLQGRSLPLNSHQLRRLFQNPVWASIIKESQ